MDKLTKLFYPIIFLICMVLVFYLVSPSLNLFNQHLFDFHDDSQLARVHEFVLNLKEGKIPPRIAPEFSYKLGFPIFNFYAPFAYWVTGLMAYTGIPEIYALKISFFLTILLGFIAMYLFLRNFFSFFSSLLGATLYVTSTYFAVEIMIRGNLAECWYLALLPLSLFFLTKNANKKSVIISTGTVLVLSFLFTSHNVFSLISLLLIAIYIFLLPNKIKNLYSVILSLLIASYFLFPSVLELNQTHAVSQAELVRYQDHFLCSWQLWKADGWHYGGSVPGCEGDQMSFKLGKTQIILAILGLFILVWQIFVKKKMKKNSIPFFIASLTIVSLFMTLYQSQLVWSIFDRFLAVFQFPWRFLVFGMFGVAFLGAYFFHHVKIPFKTIIILLIIFILFLTGKKYFGKPLYDPKTYNDLYNSQKFRETKIAYKIREYLTKNADPAYWWSLNPSAPEYQPINFDYKLPIDTKGKFKVLKDDYFEKRIKLDGPQQFKINIHYFPFWQIFINNKQYIPKDFDNLGRPIININQSSNFTVIYKQTLVEKIGNLLTILGVILLLLRPFFKL